MNISIRTLREKDAEISVKWRNIPDIWTHTTFKADREITLQDERNWIQKVINEETSARFAIMVDDVYVGNIYITNIDNEGGEYHIFIGDKNYWGKGVASAASRLILDYAKEVLQLKYIDLHVKKDNQAAFHIYEKLGFKPTGKSRDEFVSMRLYL